ncbi:telomere-protecting terminal protein Tpg [Streptomyces sp. bgisy082]|uniref:telomere-protecting terminal protein Tpg n=1 Tax=Streptomyces sp. bgisy082 TaxID=3413776 RepID=UPI003D70D318
MAGEIEEAIERAERSHFTQDPPKTLKGQINYLLKQLGSTKAVAAELGVTADSVNRYRRRARPDVAVRIDDAVRSRWQPGIRKRHRKKAAASGITVETRARFGYSAPVGTTDENRLRRLTVKLPASYARRLFDAQDRGLGDQRMREIVAEGFKEAYFQDNGSRAMGLSEVKINDIDYLDIEY